MTERKWEKSPEELVDLFYQVMKKHPEVELRKMFGYPCAFVNGNMCVGLHQRNMIVRLEKSFLESELEKGAGERFEPMKGRVMREYLSLSEEILQNPKAVSEYVAKSIEYVKTLPIKLKKGKYKK